MMKEKSRTPKAAAGMTAKGPVSATKQRGSSTANSVVRKSSLEPYHDIAATVFNINDTVELENMFLAAARDGDFAQIEALLRRRNEAAYSIDVRDPETGNTAIIWAAMRGHFKIVQLLLRNGADVTLRNYEGQTSIEVSSPNIRQLLLDAVTVGGPHRNLLQAAWQGNATLVRKILADQQVDINCRNSDGLTPLLLVTRDVQLFDKLGDKMTKAYNPIDVAIELLAHRADPNVEDEDGRSPLHYVSSSKAAHCGQLTKILLKDGADTEKRDRRCFTPIHCAAQSGNVEVVIALLDGGSESNSRGFAGTTPLHISAINGNAQVVATLLRHGADVRIVDDSGLTCVDVAKTKKVKVTLKEAWTEVTQGKAADLRPVKTPESIRRGSQTNGVPGISQNRGKKCRGEVIFDSLPVPAVDPITPRRASTISSIEHHLGKTDKAKRAEDQMYRELASASHSTRGRTPTSCPRSPTAGRRLSPIKAGASPRKNRRELKFGPGTKPHDGGMNTHTGLKKSLSDPSKVSPEASSIPVTVIGLDLDDGLQEVRVRRMSSNRPVSGRIVHTIQHSDHYATSASDMSHLVDEMYLRGRSTSKASTLTLSDDYDDPLISTSPPRLTPIRTPSASDRNRCFRIPTTINETSTGGVGYILNIDRMQQANQNQSPVQSTSATYVNLKSRCVLPSTLTYLPESSPEGADMQMVDCSLDCESKENSPRAASATKGHSVLKGGSFKIEETRIRNSDDSGIPEDKTSSKSSSVSSSVSNLSSSSPVIPDPEDKVIPGGHRGSGSAGKETARKSSIDIKKSQSDSSLARQPGFGKGNAKCSDSAMLKQVAKDNATQSGANKSKGKVEVAKLVELGTTQSKMDNGGQVQSNKKSTSEASQNTVQTVSVDDNNEAPRLNSQFKENQKQSKDTNQQPKSSVKEPSRSERVSQAKNVTKEKSNLDRNNTSLNMRTTSQCAKTNTGTTFKTSNISRDSNANCQKKWNSSTNRNSVNAKFGCKNKPLVPARLTAKPQTGEPQVSSSNTSPDRGAVSNSTSVVVEEMDEALYLSQGQLASMGVINDVKSNQKQSWNTSTGNNPSKKSSSTPCAASGVKSGNTSECSTANKQTAENNQTNNGKSVSSKLTSKVQNVPKNDNVAPVRPPRRSRSQRSLSKETDSTTKQEQSVCQKTSVSPDKNDVASGSQMPRVGSEESSNDAPRRPPPPSKANNTARSPKNSTSNMTVEQVEMPQKETVAGKTTKSNTNTVKKNTPFVSKTMTTSTHVISLPKPGGENLSSRDESCPNVTITPVTSTHVVELTAGKSSLPVPNVKQIQVKPYQEETAPSEHNGPVIVDPFESLRREREQQEEEEKTARTRQKTALKQKQQLLYPKKVRTPDARVASAGGKTKRTIKSAGSEKNDKLKPKNPQNKKVRKKKKKPEKEDLMLTDRPEGVSTHNKKSANGLGKGWCLHTDGNDNTGVKDSKFDSYYSDDDDDDTTWVQPNYMYEESDDDGDILTTSMQRNDDSVRRSWEKKSKSIPGQIYGDESTDDADEDIFDEVEDVQLDVMFTIGSASDDSPDQSARDIIDITEETIETQSVFKSMSDGSHGNHRQAVLWKVTVKGTSDHLMPDSPRIVPQVSQAIKEFSRKLTGNDLDEMLEGGLENLDKRKESCDNCDKLSKEEQSVQKNINNKGKNVVKRSKSKDHEDRELNAVIVDDNNDVKKSKSEETKHNKVVRHSEGFKAPKEKVKSAKSHQREDDEEMDSMINEILKATPDPSLTLSWRSQSEVSTRPADGEGSIKRETMEQTLLDSQNRSFKEIPNVASGEEDLYAQIAENEKDLQGLQILVDTYMSLHTVPLSDDQKQLPKGKPPVAPKPLSSGKQAMIQPIKSPRFVRKHDSLKGRQVKVIMTKDSDSMATFGSDFGTASLPMDDQDTLVPSDRAETVTSCLGRRNSTSGTTSSMTNSSEDVETIQWKRGNLLGKGAFGKVWCGLTNAGELIAVKQIELNIENMEKAEREYEKIQEEVELLKTLKHQNIVGYLGTSLEDNVVSIFMQFVPGGSIYNLITRFGALEEEVFCRYTLQILEGVEYLHCNSVIHRDIKGGNIMLMPNGVIKLIDFGCAKRLYLNISPGMNSSCQKNLLMSMRGTPYWMAPEVVREEGHGTKSDIWSIGCTVYEMATMKPPWADVAPYAAIFAIGDGSKPVPRLPTKFSSDARSFVSACLTRDQCKRPSASEMLSHAFMLKRKKKSGSFG